MSSAAANNDNCTIIVHYSMESYIVDRITRGAKRLAANFAAISPDRIVFVLFAILMIQLGTTVLVRSVRLSKGNVGGVYVHEISSIVFFILAAMSIGLFLLDVITAPTGLTLIDSFSLFCMVITTLFSMGHATENYVKVDGKLRKMVYCEAERVQRVFDDEDREHMTWDNYWNFNSCTCDN